MSLSQPIKRSQSDPSEKVIQIDSNHYIIFGIISEGTYGVVYKAFDTQSKKILALKKVKMDNETHGFPITALREIKFLEFLQHDNIIKLYNAFLYSQTSESLNSVVPEVFLTFEYAEFDLIYLKQHIDFDQDDIRYIMNRILQGIEFMHKNHILHRDLKPANILVNKNGVVKLGDFGLARKLDTTKSLYTLKVVTRNYRPLELFFGKRDYGAEIDMWSVGCIFGFLLLGKNIFAGETEEQIVHSIYELCGTPPPDSDLFALPKYSDYICPPSKPRRINYEFRNFDDDTIDLLDKLLEYDSKRRITATDALNHPYFSKGCWNTLKEKTIKLKERDCKRPL